MGVLTDFFVASPTELREAFPSWLEVADKPIRRETTNPFTGQPQVVEEWPSAQPAATDVNNEEELANYRHLPHAEFKSIDTVMLAKLQGLIGGVPYDVCYKQFARPALIDPHESYEEGLFQLSTDFVNELAAVADSNISNIATDWAAIKEMESTRIDASYCGLILRELIRLAIDARRTQRDMYNWWSL